MNTKSYIRFLGTTGSKDLIFKNIRAACGLFMNINENKIYLDPGPGAMYKFVQGYPDNDITDLDAIILSHIHFDHSTDVNVFIEGMTKGGKVKKGYLFAPDEALNGEKAVIHKYLRDFPKEIFTLKENESYSINDITFKTSVAHKHSAENYGFIFNINGVKLSIVTDTAYFPELLDSYAGSDILILHVADLQREKNHLCFEDLREIIPVIKPKKTILTHFGASMQNANPQKLAQEISRELNSQIIAAEDDMIVYID